MAGSQGSKAAAAAQRERYYELRDEGLDPYEVMAAMDLSYDTGCRCERWYRQARPDAAPLPALTARDGSNRRRKAAQALGLPSPWN